MLTINPNSAYLADPRSRQPPDPKPKWTKAINEVAEAGGHINDAVCVLSRSGEQAAGDAQGYPELEDAIATMAAYLDDIRAISKGIESAMDIIMAFEPREEEE